jgi:hypothetical protein
VGSIRPIPFESGVGGTSSPHATDDGRRWRVRAHEVRSKALVFGDDDGIPAVLPRRGHLAIIAF